MERREIEATLSDLSEEGLALLLRVGLNTATRYVDDEQAMAALIREKSVSVEEITSGELWAAGIGEDIYEFGSSAWAAAASAIVRQRFPDGPAFTLPKVKAPEIFKEGYLDSPACFTAKMSLRREESDKIDVWIYYPDA